MSYWTKYGIERLRELAEDLEGVPHAKRTEADEVDEEVALIKEEIRRRTNSNESEAIDAADIVIPSITGESLTNAEIYIYHDNGDEGE